MPTAPDRIAPLDLVRGVAVLGIIAVNILAFSGPVSGNYAPDVPLPGSAADGWTFAAMMVLFEGKMRALFSILFGASLLLFIDRAEAQGNSGAALQVRRLGWLALFGYFHFLLLWDGDILFLYAVAGLAALVLRRAEPLPMVASALLLFTAWQAVGMARWLPAALLEQSVATGQANADGRQRHEGLIAQRRQADVEDIATLRLGMAAQVGEKLAERPFWPLRVVVFMIGETLAYVLIGMALMRGGFFTGGWSGAQLGRLAWLGIGLGGAATLAFTGWAMARGWPEMAMHTAINHGLAYPHLLMALGYAALLVRAAPRLLASRLGARVAAAGRMALTNYIATSLAMTALFHGWGLGLAGSLPETALALIVIATWAAMLAWSAPWLARFGQGPLERLWRWLAGYPARPAN